MPEPEIRGARDLAALWSSLPAAALAYPASAWPADAGLAALSDTLRAQAWRDHCVSATPASCADEGRHCARPNGCLADALFPMAVGGGAPSWRMATLFVQWRPALEELRLITLGAPACGALGWAARCLRERHGLDGASPLEVATLGDLTLPRASRWTLTLVTPWLVGKGAQNAAVVPDATSVAHVLCKAMRMRAHKLTALCFDDERVQRLGGHLVHHVADTLLPGAIEVEQVHIEPAVMTLASRGNGAEFSALTWGGHLVLRVAPAVLPWLTLIVICGGGENADKGFGAVELTPLD